MNLTLTPVLAVVAAVAVTGALAAPAASAGTVPCQRIVTAQPEVSTGEDTGAATISVLSSGCAAAGEVAYWAVPGTAQTPADFILPSGALHWDAGDTGARTITAHLTPDRLREADLEEFTLALAPSGPDLRLTNPTVRERILDDDGPGLLITIDDRNCPRVDPDTPPDPDQWCACGMADLIHGVVDCPPPGRSNTMTNRPAPTQSTVHWSTMDGTARAGVDYIGVVDRVLTVPAGASGAAIVVSLLPRPAGTPSRSFYLRIVNPSTGTVADSVSMITIRG